jgi:hypothetical protein
MNIYHKLESLRTNVWFWQGIYEQKNTKEAYDKVNSAKELLKAFKRDNMPYLLEQPKHNFKPIPFVPMDTWCEQFENYSND